MVPQDWTYNLCLKCSYDRHVIAAIIYWGCSGRMLSARTLSSPTKHCGH